MKIFSDRINQLHSFTSPPPFTHKHSRCHHLKRKTFKLWFLDSWPDRKTRRTNLRSLWDIIIHGTRQLSSCFPARRPRPSKWRGNLIQMQTRCGKINWQRESCRACCLVSFSPVENQLVEDACVRRVAAELSVGVHLQCCCHSEVVRSGVETGGAARRFLRQDYSSAPERSANQTHSLYVSCIHCTSLHLCYCSFWSIMGLLYSHLVMYCCRAAPQMCGTVPWTKGSRLDLSWERQNPLRVRDLD